MLIAGLPVEFVDWDALLFDFLPLKTGFDDVDGSSSRARFADFISFFSAFPFPLRDPGILPSTFNINQFR